MGERFGKFEIITRIATGGMAEIFLAKQVGIEGFQKLIVIKRILPHLSSDKEFVNMFLDEARMAAQLNHPNIVQIYDLGVIEGSYFIAMEYIDGVDISSILKKGREKKNFLRLGWI
ncbi:MAG: serine/threonine protein kinase, partial [Myxococcota bacterium]